MLSFLLTNVLQTNAAITKGGLEMRWEGWFCQGKERENKRGEKVENKIVTCHLARLNILLVESKLFPFQTMYLEA